MEKFYIHQLRGGKMLVFEDGMFSIEETGYPLPDCSLPVANKVLTHQSDIFKAIMGYEPEDSLAFIEFLEGIEPMDFNTFKFTVQSQNIGGGCPDKLNKIALDIMKNGLSFSQAAFKYIMPTQFIYEVCVLPEDDDIKSEYGDLIDLSWNYKVNKPNSRFRNNIIMFTGIRHISEKHVDFVKDLRNICMSSIAKEQFNYLTTIIAENGIGVIILIDSTYNNADLEYFYSKVTGVDLGDGYISAAFDGDNVTLSFVCTDNSVKDYYANIKEFKGKYKRYNL